jgi:dipeptidyl aminopeptidase/acylaminoacyl peptidase
MAGAMCYTAADGTPKGMGAPSSRCREEEVRMAQTRGTRGLTLDDFWSLKTVTDVQLSPDGVTVAYVVGSYDEVANQQRSAIWLAPLDGGAPPRQLTSGLAKDSQPRWAPDGTRLAFVSTREGDNSQIYVMRVTGGEPRGLTTTAHSAHSPAWSPDGTCICFVAEPETERQHVTQETAWLDGHPGVKKDDPRLRRQTALMARFDGRGYIERRHHLFVLAVDEPGAAPRQLTDGDADDDAPAWSPDGELIAFTSNRRENAEHTFLAADIWTVEVQFGAKTCLTDGSLEAMAPAWSPDGQTLAFYANPEWTTHGYRDTHVWSVSRAGDDQRDISAQLDRSHGGISADYITLDDTPPVWSPDGQTIYLLATDAGDDVAYALPAAGGDARRLSPAGWDVRGIQCAPDGQTLACLAGSSTQPYDVFTQAAAGGNLRPIAQTNRGLLDELIVTPARHITFAGAKGWQIEGWLITPEDGGADRPYPLVLQVHGGPYGAWGNSFYLQARALASAGYATLYVNPRGSTGYGEAFAAAADWGADDYLDLMAGVDAALATGEPDPQRLAVTGVSYGGFMTNWVLGHSDRFAAGISINGIANLTSFEGTSDIGAVWYGSTYGPFWKNEETWQHYRERSPITYVERITAPLLLIQSEEDYRCPIEQGEQMLTALRVLRRTVELVRIPGASHSIVASAAPHHRYLRWLLLLDWLDGYVKGEQPQPDAAASEVAEVAEVTEAERVTVTSPPEV